MTSAIKKPDVSTPSAAYLSMKPKWELSMALLGGTDAMRDKGEVYLPRHKAEDSDAYNVRLSQTTLLNMFGKAVTNLSGKPFAKPVTLGEKLPEKLKPIIKDADLQGNNITVFSKDVFSDALGKGMSFILVDFPEVDPAKVRNLAEEREANARPYFIHVPAESLIAAYSEKVNGKEVLTHVRLRECAVERDGDWGEKQVERVRVLEPGSWALWEQGKNKKWEKVKEGKTSIDFIPLVPFYAKRDGFMTAKLPLHDLAHKNVEHWQVSSNHLNALKIASFPILAGSGINANSSITIGPNKILTTEDPNGEFYYLEHEGKALEAGRQHLLDLKDEMAMLGIELLVRKGGTTATEKDINNSNSLSEVEEMAERFSDALELAFSYAAKWLNLEVDDEAIEVTLFSGYGITQADAKDVDVLWKARVAREISREAWVAEMKRRNVLRDEYDAEADEELIQKEAPAMGMGGLPPPGTAGGNRGGPPGGVPEGGKRPAAPRNGPGAAPGAPGVAGA